ncbi:MAG: winged helix-turn-helix transcriptional regulator [Pseudomonadota bacterium]|nr:winged helix-turn-helix transcriptional regulator [Pseudomonadota bacterium]
MPPGTELFPGPRIGVRGRLVPTVPPQVTYGLTERGRELDEALRSLQTLADRWEARNTAP